MKKFFSEFKEFAIKGNMLDLAVGMIIGASFNAIVKSLVDDIIMPTVGLLIAKKDFSSLAVTVEGATIKYGMLIQNLVNFIITAMCLFLVVKALNKFRRKKEEPQEEAPAEKAEDIVLLEQIKDALVEIQKNGKQQ